ncbi:hypothetical protein JTE90_026310 [Oedothorax gibbosus]|uniref:Uncharacterized protein n=1 Tax=Oedothorax gibbosus TaxID=931172 RepID=A0AAV6U619_9ARAC|nr:hypothetical protein JTE90_026310 [Oedothorax gibbosus]
MSSLKNDPAQVGMVKKKPQFKPRSLAKPCTRCGTKHEYNKCPAFQKVCKLCKKLNHFAKCCKTKKVDSYEEEISSHHFVVSSLSSERNQKDWFELVEFENKYRVNMKLDTSAQCNMLSKEQARSNLKIRSATVRNLVSFSKDRLRVIGESKGLVKVKGQEYNVKFYIGNVNVQAILGEDTGWA